MAAEMETQSLTVNVWYHDVKLQSGAFRPRDGGDLGWVPLDEPMPVGTSLTLEVVSGDGAPAGARIPVQVLRLREKVGEAPDPGNEVRLLTPLAEATAPAPRPAPAPEPEAPKVEAAPEPEAPKVEAAPEPEPEAPKAEAAPAPEPEAPKAEAAPEPEAPEAEAAPVPPPEADAPSSPQTEFAGEETTGDVNGEGEKKKRRRRRK